MSGSDLEISSVFQIFSPPRYAVARVLNHHYYPKTGIYYLIEGCKSNFNVSIVHLMLVDMLC